MSREMVKAASRTALTPAVWGTTYLVATELLPAGRPLLAATVRALPVGLAFIAFRRQLPRGSWWWRTAVLGCLNIGVFFALLFVAAFRLPGGVAATAGAMQPLLASGLAVPLLAERFTQRTAIAGVAGIVGVGLLVLRPSAGLDALGLLAAAGGAASMATGVVLTKRWGRPVDLITFTGWQLVAGGLVLVPLLLSFEGLPAGLDAMNVAGFAWLAIVGTGLAYANWFRGVEVLPVAVSSMLALLSPVVATIAGWIVLGQSLDAVQIVGATVVLGAVAAPQLGRPSADGRAAPSTPTRSCQAAST